MLIQPFTFDFKAGGLATTGTKRILDIHPTAIHQRTSIFLGSKDDVEDVMKFYQEDAKNTETTEPSS